MVTGPHSDAPKKGDQAEVLQASPASQCTRGSLGSQEPEAGRFGRGNDRIKWINMGKLMSELMVKSWGN